MILARLAYATEHLDPQYHTKESGFDDFDPFRDDRELRNLSGRSNAGRSVPRVETTFKRRYRSPKEARPDFRGPVSPGYEMVYAGPGSPYYRPDTAAARGGVNVRRAAAIAGASLLAGGGAAGAYHMHKNRKPAPGLMDRARDLGGRAASAARRNPAAATAAALTPFAVGGGIAAARNRG